MTFRRMVFYIVILVLVLIVAYSVANNRSNKNSTTTPVTPPTVVSTAHYSCDNGATIDASFTNNSATVALSDGRHLVLPQTISADGAQYQQGTVLFATKGDQSFLQENNATTYNNCLAGAATTPSPSGVNTFTDQGKTFTFTYPSIFTLAGGGIGYTQSWKTDSDATLGLILATVNVPQNYQPNTNLGDAKFTVGTSSDPKAVASCLKPTSGMAATKSAATINGVSYTVLTFRDAAAGNRYDTTSYRTVRNHQCYAIDYTIHYGAIENYDPSTGIKAFDEKSVQNALNGIMQTFKFL